MDCVIIRVIDMPMSLRGATVKDENGDYNIYLNARYSEETRAAAFRHEVEHIRQGHFYDQKTVKEKEMGAKVAARAPRG